MVPESCRYLETHEWARPEGDLIVVGITDVAVQLLTDLVFVDLPEVGKSLSQGEAFGEIESVKAVSDLLSPVHGKIVEVNEALADNLDLLAEDPFGAGWMIKVRPAEESGLDALMDHRAYRLHAAEAS